MNLELLKTHKWFIWQVSLYLHLLYVTTLLFRVYISLSKIWSFHVYDRDLQRRDSNPGP